MKSSLRMIAGATAAAVLLLSGCAVTPADPYYGGYGYRYGNGYDYAYPAAGYVGPAPYYAASPFLVAPALSVGVVGAYGGRSHHHHHGHHGWRGPGWRGQGGGFRGGGGGWGGHGGGGHGGGHR